MFTTWRHGFTSIRGGMPGNRIHIISKKIVGKFFWSSGPEQNFGFDCSSLSSKKNTTTLAIDVLVQQVMSLDGSCVSPTTSSGMTALTAFFLSFK
jgi:hypothetical protein